jgi:hypothetical protein
MRAQTVTSLSGPSRTDIITAIQRLEQALAVCGHVDTRTAHVQLQYYRSQLTAMLARRLERWDDWGI